MPGGGPLIPGGPIGGPPRPIGGIPGGIPAIKVLRFLNLMDLFRP